MVKVQQIHLWVRDKKGQWTTDGIRNGKPHTFPGKQIIIEPSGESIVQMKLDIARELSKIMNKIESYYVVVAVEKSDGTPGYRTIVPKTVVV